MCILKFTFENLNLEKNRNRLNDKFNNLDIFKTRSKKMSQSRPMLMICQLLTSDYGIILNLYSV